MENCKQDFEVKNNAFFFLGSAWLFLNWSGADILWGVGYVLFSEHTRQSFAWSKHSKCSLRRFEHRCKQGILRLSFRSLSLPLKSMKWLLRSNQSSNVPFGPILASILTNSESSPSKVGGVVSDGWTDGWHDFDHPSSTFSHLINAGRSRRKRRLRRNNLKIKIINSEKNLQLWREVSFSEYQQNFQDQQYFP